MTDLVAAASTTMIAIVIITAIVIEEEGKVVKNYPPLPDQSPNQNQGLLPVGSIGDGETVIAKNEREGEAAIHPVAVVRAQAQTQAQVQVRILAQVLP